MIDERLYFYVPPDAQLLQTRISDEPIEPIKLDPASFNPRKGILTRQGRKLLEEGAKYYKIISIKELIDESESKENSGGSNNPQVPN